MISARERFPSSALIAIFSLFQKFSERSSLSFFLYRFLSSNCVELKAQIKRVQYRSKMSSDALLTSTSSSASTSSTVYSPYYLASPQLLCQNSNFYIYLSPSCFQVTFQSMGTRIAGICLYHLCKINILKLDSQSKTI